jgi:hypothetical protein
MSLIRRNKFFFIVEEFVVVVVVTDCADVDGIRGASVSEDF